MGRMDSEGLVYGEAVFFVECSSTAARPIKRPDCTSAILLSEQEGRDGTPLTGNTEILEGKVWFLSYWCNSIFDLSMSRLRECSV